MKMAFDRLPQEVQDLLRRKGYRAQTVEVSPMYGSESELSPVSVDLNYGNKPRNSKYAVSPSGRVIEANVNSVVGAWPHLHEQEAPSIPLPPEEGPWTEVTFIRGWDGSIITTLIKHQRDDARYQKQKKQLTGLAASMLYVYARTQGMYRKRSREGMEAYARQVGGDPWAVAQDELLQAGLVTVLRNGELRVTPTGKEVAARLPYSYDPDSWVYRRTAEATRAPEGGLFGDATYEETPERIYRG